MAQTANRMIIEVAVPLQAATVHECGALLPRRALPEPASKKSKITKQTETRAT
jgi:hypothetical protein